jgi:hypothetical protein
MYATSLLAVLIGGVLILGALVLLYLKRISLQEAVKNPAGANEGTRIEILDLIKVGSNVPALGLFLVGLALVAAGLYFGNEEDKRANESLRSELAQTKADLAAARERVAKMVFQSRKLNVAGVVEKNDHKSAVDVQVQTGWPPFHPDANGRLNGLVVQRDGGGRLPTLSFLHPNYGPVSIDLETDARVDGNELVIPQGRVILMRLPGLGGTQ